MNNIDIIEDDNACRAAIVSLTENNLYAIVWYGHTGNHFFVLKNSRSLKSEIYPAVNETFFDFMQNDPIVMQFDISYAIGSNRTYRAYAWRMVLDKIRSMICQKL